MSKYTFVLLGVLVCAISTMPAATYQWTGLGADNNWSTDANWVDVADFVTTGVPTAGDDVNFNDASLTTDQVINLDSDTYVGAWIQVQLGADSAADYTITSSNGSTLYLATSYYVKNASTAGHKLTFDVPVQLAAGTYSYINSLGGEIVYNKPLFDGQAVRVDFRAPGKVTLNATTTNSSSSYINPVYSDQTTAHIVVNADNALPTGGISLNGSTDVLIEMNADTTHTGRYFFVTHANASVLTLRVGEGDTDHMMTMGNGSMYDANDKIVLAANGTGGAGNVTLNLRGGVYQANFSGTFEIESGQRLLIDHAVTDAGLQNVGYEVGGSLLGTTISGAAGGMIEVASNANFFLFSNDGVAVPTIQTVQVKIDGQLKLNGHNQDSMGLITGSGVLDLTGASATVAGVAPGNSVGTLTVADTGTLTLTGTSTFEMGDLVSISAADLVLGGDLVGVGYAAGTYTLFDLDTGLASGAFASVSLDGGLSGSVYIDGTTGDVMLDVTGGSVPGDANGDGYVSDADYTIWADTYGTADPRADWNGDGNVTDADYTIWADNYTGVPSSSAAVPEPTTIGLLVFGVAGLLRKRR